jgi:hypothetical protein
VQTALSEVRDDLAIRTARPLIPTQPNGPADQLARRVLAVLRRHPGRVLVSGGPGAVAETAGLIQDREPELAQRVDCMDVHDLARSVLRRREIDPHVDVDAAQDAWDAAWSRVGVHSVLSGLDLPERWRAEVAGAIKGRGVTRACEYQAHPAAVTEQVWDLYVAYSEELTIRFTHDLDDLVAMALDELAISPARLRYASVVIDPASGLTPVMLRLLRAVAARG